MEDSERQYYNKPFDISQIESDIRFLMKQNLTNNLKPN